MYLGIKAVFARSFARIHRSNLINFGILPVVIDEDTYTVLEKDSKIMLKNILRALSGDGDLDAYDAASGRKLGCTISLSPREQDILRQGGLLNYIKSQVRGRNDT